MAKVLTLVGDGKQIRVEDGEVDAIVHAIEVAMDKGESTTIDLGGGTTLVVNGRALSYVLVGEPGSARRRLANG